MKRVMMNVMGLGLSLSLGLGVVGCGGPKAEGGGEAKTAKDENAPPPPSDEDIQKGKQQETAPKPPPGQTQAQAKAAAKVAADERSGFDGCVTKWDASKKAGTVMNDCRSLASCFESEGRSHKGLASQAYFNAGTLLDQCGDEKGAEDKYKAALDTNPANGFALNNLGEIYYRRGNPATAKSWFEKAIQADPTHVASAYNNLAVLIYNQALQTGDKGLFTDAISKLRRALAIDSDSMVAYNLLALIYYQTAGGDRSKLQLAELVCKQGRETNDKYPPIYNTQGLIQLRKKNVTGALKDFEQAVALDPKYVEAHLNIGAIGLSSRQYEKAEQSFRAVLKLQPSNVDATIGLGVALRGQRKFDEAEQSYKKAKELDPKNCAVPYDLGVLYQDYKATADNSNLRDAQKFFNEFVGCPNADKSKVQDAQRRSKDIDETFVAIAEQKKAEEEMNKMKEEMERQQKEQQKQMEEQQKQQPPPAAGDKPADKKENAAPAPAGK
jgi:tetratricopeptide (TPR) repeat protein